MQKQQHEPNTGVILNVGVLKVMSELVVVLVMVAVDMGKDQKDQDLKILH